MRHLNRYRWLGMILVGLFILGCSKERVVLLCHNRMCTTPMLVKRLRQQGVGVYQVGETMRLVMPSHLVFNNGSANLRIDFRPAMDNIVTLLKRYDKIVVKVKGYTSDQGDWKHNRALSRQQAATVVTYLWKRKIDSRLIYAQGYGEERAVATNASPWGRKMNNRVEISLKFAGTGG